MPFRSRSQERWGFTDAGKKALGGEAKVKEWADSTDQGSLPAKVGSRRGLRMPKKAVNRGGVQRH